MPRPGLVDVALSWSDLQHAVEENTVESLGRLGRFEENILVYRAFRAQVVEEWKSMTDFMYNRVFGWEPRVNEDGKKVVDICKADGKRIVWMQNDFPYSCDPGIEHHNVWCTEELAKDEVWHVIRSNRPHHDCLMFVNPPVLQSIPTVWHCHVFSRPLPDSGGIN